MKKYIVGLVLTFFLLFAGFIAFDANKKSETAKEMEESAEKIESIKKELQRQINP